MPIGKRCFQARSALRGLRLSMTGLALTASAWLLLTALTVERTAAMDMPGPADLEQALSAPPQTIEVVEPHLSTADSDTVVAYRGWPAVKVLDHLLGSDWNKPGVDVEFRALDGYVSRIPAERFSEYPAYLVFESPGRSGFTVNNPRQNEKDVLLGPYYLVWDNVRHPGLLADGATNWPYQVSEVLVSDTGWRALLPGDMAGRYDEDAGLARKYCLTCHRINGYGGDKFPIDLAHRVKDMTATEFERWVLTPNAVKPGATMPPLAHRIPEPKREVMAKRLYAYLRAFPAQKQ